jgi:hypothetical protein
MQQGGALKEDALAVLKANGVDTTNKGLDDFLFGPSFKLSPAGTSANEVIFGDYTFGKFRDMSRTYELKAWISSDSGNKVVLYSFNDY